MRRAPVGRGAARSAAVHACDYATGGWIDRGASPSDWEGRGGRGRDEAERTASCGGPAPPRWAAGASILGLGCERPGAKDAPASRLAAGRWRRILPAGPTSCAGRSGRATGSEGPRGRQGRRRTRGARRMRLRFDRSPRTLCATAYDRRYIRSERSSSARSRHREWPQPPRVTEGCIGPATSPHPGADLGGGAETVARHRWGGASRTRSSTEDVSAGGRSSAA